MDPNHKYGDFCEFDFDPHLTERCLGGLAIVYDPGDDDQAQKSLTILRDKMPTADYYPMPGFGHFMIGNKMQGPEFPELLAKVL
jgi:hypothetical protein